VTFTSDVLEEKHNINVCTITKITLPVYKRMITKVEYNQGSNC